MIPAASSGTSRRSASPSCAWATAALEGRPTGVAVRTSPSGSESLTRTGSTVERPGRTPKTSSTASGAWFSSVRSGWDWESEVRAESSSVSESSSVWLVTSVQSSTSTSCSSGSHTLPVTMSLMTMASRLTRKTGAPAEPRASSWTVVRSEPHWRTYWPEPDQAA